mmetsp:Transcript_20397/g.40117  ORF Transcript_20397/g.40117 Transcript_20397/m.40117 type:complete len:107 (-) Transcript_20397:576-896(-)
MTTSSKKQRTTVVVGSHSYKACFAQSLANRSVNRGKKSPFYPTKNFLAAVQSHQFVSSVFQAKAESIFTTKCLSKYEYHSCALSCEFLFYLMIQATTFKRSSLAKL